MTKKIKINISLFVAIALYVISQCGLWLISNNSIRDLAPILSIIWVSAFLIHKKSLKLYNRKLLVLLVLPVLLAFISAIQEKILYHSSSIIASFINQRQWWSMGITIIPLMDYIYTRKISYDFLRKAIYFIGIIQIGIGLLQGVLQNVYIFTSAPIGQRYGVYRFYFPIVLMTLTYFIAYNELLNGRSKLKSSCVMLAYLLEAVFVQNFRMTIAAVSLATVIGFVVWKKIATKKILIGMLIGTIFAVVVFNNEYLLTTFRSIILSESEGVFSLNIRQRLFSGYIKDLKYHPILGAGWVSSDAAFSHVKSFAYVYTAEGQLGYSFADGGIMSILYSYGMLGIVWAVYLWSYMLKVGVEIKRKYNNFLFLLFPLYMVFSCYLDIHWYIHFQFYVMVLFNVFREAFILRQRNQLI